MLMISTNCYQVKLTEILSEHKLFLWLAIIWTAIIAVLCLVNFNDLPSVQVSFSDKIGHFVFHYGLTTLWFLYYKFQRSNPKVKALLKAFLFSLFYGIAIEISQALFTDSRKADVFDVLANMTGSILAVSTLLLLQMKRKKSTIT